MRGIEQGAQVHAAAPLTPTLARRPARATTFANVLARSGSRVGAAATMPRACSIPRISCPETKAPRPPADRDPQAEGHMAIRRRRVRLGRRLVTLEDLLEEIVRRSTTSSIPRTRRSSTRPPIATGSRELAGREFNERFRSQTLGRGTTHVRGVVFGGWAGRRLSATASRSEPSSSTCDRRHEESHTDDLLPHRSGQRRRRRRRVINVAARARGARTPAEQRPDGRAESRPMSWPHIAQRQKPPPS